MLKKLEKNDMWFDTGTKKLLKLSIRGAKSTLSVPLPEFED
ncbi:MAG: hypothetical protein ABEJ24_03460 [Candidatus Magasanikbacteria bacterium]